MRFRVSQRRQARQDILENWSPTSLPMIQRQQRLCRTPTSAYSTTLVSTPDIGRPYASSHSRLRDVRAISIGRFRNYLIFYRRTADEVEVLRVLHGARDIRSILGAEQL